MKIKGKPSARRQRSGVTISQQHVKELIKSRNSLPIDDEVLKLSRKGKLRRDLVVDPVKTARAHLLYAVQHGHAEVEALASQARTHQRWYMLERLARRAQKSVKAQKRLASELSFAEVFTLEAMGPFSRPPGEARKAAVQTRIDLMGGSQDAIARISNQIRKMRLGVASKKKEPGEPFWRGFVLGMMKCYWLLTGHEPSSKRSDVGNRFARFANAALDSCSGKNQEKLSAAHAVRSTLKVFKDLRNGGAFSSDLIEATGGSLTNEEAAALRQRRALPSSKKLTGD